MKFKDKEEADLALTAAKEEREVAVQEFKTFKKENKCKDTPPTDEKLLKRYTKLEETKKKKEKAVEDIRAWVKDNKPKKEKTERPSKYEYPDDCTTALDKKKFRAKIRAEAKRKEKGDAPKKEKKEGKSKKEKKAEKKAKNKEKKEEKTETANQD